MTAQAGETIFADVSYYQPPVNNDYPHQFFAFRSNDGMFRDPNFVSNFMWAATAADHGRIAGFLVYCVYRPDWKPTADTQINLILQAGGPHPKMALMIDMESWGGQLSGNQSASANQMRDYLIDWLGGDPRRVIAYANEGDRQRLWPQYGDAKWIIANYGYNPQLPDQIAHQYSSTTPCPPFGKCDSNWAGYSPTDFAAVLGLSGEFEHDIDSETEEVEDDMWELNQASTSNTQKIGTAGPVLLKVDDEGHVSLCHGPCKFQAQVQVSVEGLPAGKTLSLRYVLYDVDDATGTPTEGKNFAITEIVGTAGNSYGQAFQQGKIGDPKGCQRRLRIHASTAAPGVAVTHVAATTFYQEG